MLRRLPAGLGPVPLKLGKMGDGTALLVTPLCGRNVAAKLPPAPEVLEFIKSLEVSAPLALPDHPYVRAVRDRGGTQLDSALEDLATKAWPINLQHGDFAPWNLRQDRHVGTICAFDWEYGTENGFPYIVNAGEKIHRRAGVKMHHGRRHSAATLNSAFQFDQ